MKRAFSIFARTSLLLLRLAATGSFARAQQPAVNQLSFVRREELYYEAEFKKGLLRGANIGEFRFCPRPEQTSAGDPLRLVADVVSKGFFPKLAGIHFHEHVESIVEPNQFMVMRTNKLEVGKSFEIPVSDSGQVFRMSVAVVERKRINCVLGRVNAIRIEPAMFGEGRMLRGEGKMSIWITEYSRHLPVWAQLKLNIGTVDIKLKRITYQNTAGER